jgi:hypothetical protein
MPASSAYGRAIEDIEGQGALEGVVDGLTDVESEEDDKNLLIEGSSTPNSASSIEDYLYQA